MRIGGGMAERAGSRRDRVPVDVVAAPPRFLAGQESALANAISGGPALPGFTPPRIRGVAGAPTLVQNVETLAHLTLIARYGAAWFRSAGTPAEPGTMLVTSHQVDGRVVVDEVEIGAPLRSILDVSGCQAVLVGGDHRTRILALESGPLRRLNARLPTPRGSVRAGRLPRPTLRPPRHIKPRKCGGDST